MTAFPSCLMKTGSNETGYLSPDRGKEKCDEWCREGSLLFNVDSDLAGMSTEGIGRERLDG